MYNIGEIYIAFNEGIIKGVFTRGKPDVKVWEDTFKKIIDVIKKYPSIETIDCDEDKVFIS